MTDSNPLVSGRVLQWAAAGGQSSLPPRSRGYRCRNPVFRTNFQYMGTESL